MDDRAESGGPQPNASSRLQTDTIRGIACLMLVAYHVVGVNRVSGMGVADGSLYRTLIADGPALVRMPLFTFLSGFVYAYRPVATGGVGTFVLKKVRRLLIPLVVVSTLAALLQSVVPSTNAPIDLHELWRIYIWPFGLYWYLPALMLIFLVVVVLDRLHLIDKPSHFGLVFGAAVAVFFLASNAPEMFGLGYAMYLLPFFLWGVGVNRFSRVITVKLGRRGAVALGLAAVVANVVVVGFGVDVDHDRISAFGLVVGLCVTLGLQMLAPTSRWLARLGGYSFAIYLYHVFGTAGARILVRKVVDVDPVVFIVSLIGGVVFSIGVCELARRTPLSRLLFLGEAAGSTRGSGATPVGSPITSNEALGT